MVFYNKYSNIGLNFKFILIIDSLFDFTSTNRSLGNVYKIYVYITPKCF